MQQQGCRLVVASVSEAIQSPMRDPGLLRRFAPRNDGRAAIVPALDEAAGTA
jgi:hypothetical protein